MALSRRQFLRTLAASGAITAADLAAILFTFLQRHLIQGLTAGALKG